MAEITSGETIKERVRRTFRPRFGAGSRTRVIIMGAAGRDFHNFNVLFRDNEAYEVVAFTATQIPYIADRRYPPELSGRLYPHGIQIVSEEMLPRLIRKYDVDVCIQAYSDVPYQKVMSNSSIVNSAGADFWLISPEHTMIRPEKPVIAVCAVRTGCGKSQTSRYIAEVIKETGRKPIVIRHPMPYGNLKEQAVQRFTSLEDLDTFRTTIEEREDYEPHIRAGTIVYSGVDYERILREAENEADIIIWDGGNNDAPFIKPDLTVAVADPLRAGDELKYYPGETVARLADILLINKVNSATNEEVDRLRKNLKEINPRARILDSESIVSVDHPEMVRGKRVLVVEDGPTITHGGMSFGAGTVAARELGASDIVEARKYAVGSIAEAFDAYPHLKMELTAMGYNGKQIEDLEETINRADGDIVLSATPADLRGMLKVNKPIVSVSYELKPKDLGLREEILKFLEEHHAIHEMLGQYYP